MGSIRAQICLRDTLESGQVFRYEEKDGWWYIQNGDRLFSLRTDGDRLFYGGDADAAFIRSFFSLDLNADGVLERHGEDRTVRQAITRHAGLRLIRQDPWECIVAFLCSSAANIPKIRRNVEHLSRTYGKPLRLGGYSGHSFAPLGSLNDMDVLKAAGTGFRARYIYEANAMVGTRMISAVDRASYDDAKEILLEVPGIGEKIADCILLFGFGKTEAFPVDVWMQRAMSRMYFGGRQIAPEKIAAFGRERFGKDAGFIQQMIFHAERMGSKKG